MDEGAPLDQRGRSSRFRSGTVAAVLQPGGGVSAAQPSTTPEPYTCPCPGGTLIAKTWSTAVCQNVTTGYQCMSGDTSGPRGSSSHCGCSKISSGLHQTIGSDEFCRYTTAGGVPVRARRSAGRWVNSTTPAANAGSQ